MSKPIVLVIISNYLPGEKSGGPVRTTSNMVEWLGDDFNFRILTSDRDIGDENPYSHIEYGVWHSVGKAKVRYLSPREQSLSGLRKIINAITYDIIYVNAVFSGISIKTFLLHRLNLLPNKNIVVAPRGQWFPKVLQIKPIKKHVFLFLARQMGLYKGFLWHVSSPAEAEDVVREVGVSSDSILIASNLPVRDITYNNDFRPLPKVSGHVKIVFLSRFVRNKGLDFILKQLSVVHGDVQFHIYGSIEDEIYWKECQQLIARLPDNVKVEYKGVVQFDAVIDTLSKYHLFVLPTLSENFGHVILESLLAGCPVLISDRTPWQNLNGAGWVLRLEDTLAWQNTLQEMIDMQQEQFEQMSQNARTYGERYQGDHQLTDDLRAFFISSSNK